MNEARITMEHGSGGTATGALIDEVFAGAFDNDVLNAMEDAAVVGGAEKIAMTTDSFVVTPVEFPGGDIGRLCICGTVNDILMRGAQPKYITCGFIIEEGTPVELLKRVVRSMADTAREAGVMIVAGDTKVIDSKNPDGGIVINTAGVGFVKADISAKNAKDGDAIIVSGAMGDHHAAILSQRLSIKNNIESDNAPLTEMVMSLVDAGIKVHVLRDVTRGGLGTVLKELATSSQVQFDVSEAALPVHSDVKNFAGLLGLDPFYMGNEGKMVAIVAAEDAKHALEIIKTSKYGEEAAIIGSVRACDNTSDTVSATKEGLFSPGKVSLTTALGGKRELNILVGEGLPRIC